MGFAETFASPSQVELVHTQLRVGPRSRGCKFLPHLSLSSDFRNPGDVGSDSRSFHGRE